MAGEIPGGMRWRRLSIIDIKIRKVSYRSLRGKPFAVAIGNVLAFVGRFSDIRLVRGEDNIMGLSN